MADTPTIPNLDELPEFLVIGEAAAVARRTEDAMHALRRRKRGPRAQVVDGRLLYRKADLVAWLSGEDAPVSASADVTLI